jgi:hypothetical protein
MSIYIHVEYQLLQGGVVLCQREGTAGVSARASVVEMWAEGAGEGARARKRQVEGETERVERAPWVWCWSRWKRRGCGGGLPLLGSRTGGKHDIKQTTTRTCGPDPPL